MVESVWMRVFFDVYLARVDLRRRCIVKHNFCAPGKQASEDVTMCWKGIIIIHSESYTLFSHLAQELGDSVADNFASLLG